MNVLLVSPLDRFENVTEPRSTAYSERALRSFCGNLDHFNYRKSTFSTKLHLLRYHCRYFKEWDDRRAGRKLVDTVMKNRYDVVIIFKAETIPAKSIFELREKTSALVVGWCADSPLEYPAIKKALPAYHSMALWDTGYLDVIREAGVGDTFYLPLFAIAEAMDEALEWPAENPPVNLSFIGTWSEYRERILKPLLPLGLEVWGNDWRKKSSFPASALHRELSYHDMLKVLSDSRLTVNVHHPQGINDANSRTFEAMGTGAPVVDELHSDILKFFRPHEHFIPWDGSPQTLYGVVSDALATDRDSLRDMGIRARREILSGHLIEHRWKAFFEHIDLLLSRKQ